MVPVRLQKEFQKGIDWPDSLWIPMHYEEDRQAVLMEQLSWLKDLGFAGYGRTRAEVAGLCSGRSQSGP